MTLTVLLVFVPILVGVLLVANALLSVRKPDAAKVAPFECGIMPLKGQARAPFSVLYYLLAILFLSFDLEILLIFPIATTLDTLGVLGFVVAVAFFTILTLGFVVELAYGVLTFNRDKTPL